MKERAKIDQDLCTHVRILLAGGATGEQAAKITNTSTGTVSRIKSAGFDYPTFLAQTQTRRIEEKNRKADATISQALDKVREAEQIPGQVKMELVYDPNIAEEYKKEQAQKAEMSDQTKMMRFQAHQVDLIRMMQQGIIGKLEHLNDTMNQILRAIRKE